MSPHSRDCGPLHVERESYSAELWTTFDAVSVLQVRQAEAIKRFLVHPWTGRRAGVREEARGLRDDRQM